MYYYDKTYTYGELEERANRVAHALSSIGIRRGEVVSQIMPTSPEFIINMFGVLKAGAVYLPINPSLTDEEISYQLDDSSAVAVITDRQNAGRFDEMRANLPALPQVLVIDDDGSPSALTAATEVSPPEIPIAPDDVAMLFYSSGSTGQPKGALWSHRNVLLVADQSARRFLMTENDRVLHTRPLYYYGGLNSDLLAPLLYGASVALRPRFDVEEFWPAVDRYRPTYFTAVPTMYTRLLQQPPATDVDLSSLRFGRTSGAPMPRELHKEFEHRYGIIVVEGYGMTEAGIIASNPLDARRIGSVGTPLDGKEVRIFDPDDQPLEPGQIGEVVTRGDLAMLGYLNRPKETAEALRGGWLHTGDLGYFEPDGYLHLVGRMKDIIIRGGVNIAAREVEIVLCRHPAVLEAAVVGVPDPEYGERVKAFVALRKGAGVTSEELREHCCRSLARFKVPEEMFVLPEISKTKNGKIDKLSLLRSLVSR